MSFDTILFQKLDDSNVDELQKISILTFRDAFAHLNTPKNLNDYITKAFNKNQLIKELNNPKSTFLFAKHNNITLGYIKINVDQAQTDLIKENSVELERIYVLKAFQGQKIGQKLLDYTINFAKKQHKEYLWLGVWEKNDSAIHFYKKFGFKITGSHNFILGSEIQTDHIMTLALKK